MSQKLKGVYDALDHGNWKSCLKLCTAFLQKQPGHALCKALHAVALERCGRRDEAIRLSEESWISAIGVDDTVLTTVQVVYRRCRQFSLITKMYEAALTSEPDNEEYAIALFSAALHNDEFARAQQVATKLYSKHKKCKFLHWVIVALLLQARAGAPPTVLDLAAMMLRKAPMKTELLQGGQPVPFKREQLYLLLLHLDVLIMQRKYAAAMELFEACQAFVKLPSDVSALRIQLCLEGGQPREAAKEARARVLRSPGDWGAAREYVRLAFECPAPDGLPLRGSAASPDHGARLRPRDGKAFPCLLALEAVETHGTADEVWNALLLFKHVQQSAEYTCEQGATKLRPGSRTARLAQLELRRRAFCANEAACPSPLAVAGSSTGSAVPTWRAAVADADWNEFATSIQEYIVRFIHNNHCFFDVRPFLVLLGDVESAALLASLDSHVLANGTCHDSATNIARLRRALMRSPWKALDGNLEEAAAEVQRLLSNPARQHDRDQGNDSDVALPSEEFVLLAAVTLLDMDSKSCSGSQSGATLYGLDALALADMAISQFPHAFQFRVLLVLMYGTLGLASAMLRWYGTLDVKNIQHESLSYLVFDSLCAVGCHDDLSEACRSIIQFHEDIDKDGLEALHATLQNGVFHRTPEYLEALRCASRSILWGRAVVEEILCEMGQAQTWEALIDALSRQGVLLSTIMNKGPDSWVMRNQDRQLLNGLSPLPVCNPLGGANFWAESTPSGVHGSFGSLWSPRAVGSSAPAIGGCQDVARMLGDTTTSITNSAVEELLVSSTCTPEQLRLVAALLCSLATLLQKDVTSEQQLNQLSCNSLPIAHASAAEAGIDIVLDSTGATSEALDVMFRQLLGESTSRHVMPKRVGLMIFMNLSLQCALVACDASQIILNCIHGQEVWERAEAQVSTIHNMISKLVVCIHGQGHPTEGECVGDFLFGIGHRSLPWLWVLVHNCLAIVLPVTLWCCGILPKAGAGKKVKEGQESLHATRVALRNLVSTMQVALTELHVDLGKAMKVNFVAAVWPLERYGSIADIPVLAHLPGLEATRRQVCNTAAEAHSKHLLALQEAVACRLALLKSRGPFKP